MRRRQISSRRNVLETLESRLLLTGSTQLDAEVGEVQDSRDDIDRVLARASNGNSHDHPDKDDHQHGVIRLTIRNLAISEGLGLLTVTVLRTDGSEGPVTVDYRTDPNTAGFDDFEFIAGTLSFADGETGQQLQIAIRDDNLLELPESFQFRLMNATGGATLGLAEQTVTIHDNDALGANLFFDDFETAERWTIDPFSTDTATTGMLEIGSPQATVWAEQPMQPGQAADGQRALVTGLAAVASALSNDVDDGSTTALSPAFELPTDELIELSFSYFVAHDTGSSEADYLRVSIIANDVANPDPQVVFEQNGAAQQRVSEWRNERIDVTSFAGQTIRILVEATDTEAESIFEAGIDRVAVDILRDTPGIVSVGSVFLNVEEGETSTADIEVLRTRGRSGEISIEYQTIGDTAQPDVDFEARHRTLRFADGETSKRVSIPVFDDDLEESIEQFFVQLKQPGGGAVLSSLDRVTVRIVDNDRTTVGLLPDMMPLTDGMVESSFVDTTEQAGRALLRFSTTIANIGDGPLEIWGGDISGSTQEVLQRIYTDDGDSYDSLAGSFVYHADHGHIHLEGFANFQLRDVTADGQPGDVVASGGKTSFCLINVAHPFPDRTSSAVQAHGRGGDECNTVQGISVGHADVYGADLVDQWIDITDLTDGDYFLDIAADPEDSLLETDESNNQVFALISVDNPFYSNGQFIDIEVPEDDHANSATQDPAVLTARDAGSIEFAGDADWFQFQATGGNVYQAEVELRSLGDSVLRLYDQDGRTELSFDDDGGTSAGSKISWIAPEDGTYFWEVKAYSPDQLGDYQITLEELVDDHGNNSAGASPLVLNEQLEGNLEVAADEDWFQVEVVAQQYYAFSTTLRGLADSQLTVFGADGQTPLAQNDNRNERLNSQIYWLAPADGTVYVRVGAGDSSPGATGGYRLRVRTTDPPNDDHPNDQGNAALIAEGDTAARLNYEGDVDQFQFDTVAGVEYLLDIVPQAARLIQAVVQSSSGEIVASAMTDESGEIHAAWTASESSITYLTVSGVDGTVARYEVSLNKDAADTAVNAIKTQLPFSEAGDLHDVTDVDMFAFDVTAGIPYSVFTTNAIDTTLSIVAPNGQTVVAENDDESDYSTASRVNWIADTTGTHYVQVQAFRQQTGGYELNIVEGSTDAITEAGADDVSNSTNSAPTIGLYSNRSAVLDYVADEDWFRFTTVADQIYNVSVAFAAETNATIRIVDGSGQAIAETSEVSDNFASRIDWEATGRGPYYIQVTGDGKTEYVVSLDSDDHGDNSRDAEVIRMGRWIRGDIEVSDDADWFRVDPEAGHLYEIQTRLSSLDDSTLRIYDANENELAFDDDSGGELASLIGWSPTSTDPFFIEVDGLGGGTGTYSVRITEIEDDHGNNAENATPIASDESVAGSLQTSNDRDWFSVSVEAGVPYRIHTDSSANVTVHGMNESELIGGFFGMPTSFVASETGTLHVEVYDSFGNNGEYSLTIERLVDVHANSAEGATQIAVSTTTAGDIQHAADRDWFKLETSPGMTYRIDAVNSELGSAEIVLFDANGIVIRTADPHGFFFENPEASASEVFLQVSGVPGPYELTVEQLDAIPIEAPFEQLGQFPDDQSSVWFWFDTSETTSIHRLQSVGGTLRTYMGSQSRTADAETSLITFDAERVYVRLTGTASESYEFSLSEVEPTAIGFSSTERQVLSGVEASEWYVLSPQVGKFYDTTFRATAATLNASTESGDVGISANESWLSFSDELVYIEVTSNAERSSYRLAIDVSEPAQIEFGEEVNGNVEQDGGDWYRFDAIEGGSYRIETSLDSLDDSTLELFSQHGAFLQYDDDGAGDLASRIDWTAAETGPLFFVVAGLSGAAGSYSVSVGQTGGPILDIRDLNRDGDFTAADIDTLFRTVRKGTDSTFDFDSSGKLNQSDIDFFLSSEMANVLRGDTNLDGSVDFADFLELAAAFQATGGWQNGDFNGDGVIDFEDFLLLGSNFGI